LTAASERFEDGAVMDDSLVQQFKAALAALFYSPATEAPTDA
jgi:hypothetical protein